MGLTIRDATADDLDALSQLVQERDDARYGRDDVRTAFVDLDRHQGRTWLAEIDGEPAGTTSVVWRELQGLGRASYWTNLYVRPQFRARMVYPLLVRKMQAGIEADGALCCYCAVRRPRVLEGHLKLNFEPVAEYAVLARPLRPARLVQRIMREGEATPLRRAIALAAAGARPLDALAVAAARAIGRGTDAAQVEDLLPLMAGRPRGSIVWSRPQLATRLRPAIDGERYRPRRLQREAGLVWRLARRDAVEVAAILDVFGDDPRASRKLLHGACAEAASAGADVALWLDGAADQRANLRRAGFFTTPERYTLVAWPPGRLDARALRFAFLDHDAF